MKSYICTFFLGLMFLCCAITLWGDVGLQAYYPMNNNFNDASGNGNDLSCNQEASFTEDTQIKTGENTVYGPSEKDFSGAINKEFTIDTEQGFTLCGFYMLNGGNDFGGKLFGFGSNDWQDPAALVSINYGFISAKVSKTKVVQSERVSLGEWHHIALVVPKADKTNTFYTIYIDGNSVKQGSAEYTGIQKGFCLGQINGKQSDNILIDEVKVYGSALSDEQVKEESKLKGEIKKQPIVAKPVKVDMQNRRIEPDEDINIKGKLKVHFLDKNNICVVGDYNDFMVERFRHECGGFLKKFDENPGSIKRWAYEFQYKFAMGEVIEAYRPLIAKMYQDKDSFTLKNAKGQNVKIQDSGYWINAVGLMDIPAILNDEIAMSYHAKVDHFAYLHTSKPLKNGEAYSIVLSNGENISFTYDEKQNVSWLIKVDQVGYSPDSGEKYAYLGGWLGTKGKYDLSFLEGKEFYICDIKDDSVVYNGSIQLRMNDLPAEGGKASFYGEDVYQMNFSEFSKQGNYYIYVPEVGRSWSFMVGQDAIGDAFYTHARGLYHKRCGIAKEKPYTNWEAGECHKTTYKAKFVPNDRHYRKPKDGSTQDWGFFDENGEHPNLNQFEVVKETQTDEVAEGVWGGWHDAGDFDRRTYHFQVVRDLLSAYLMFPENFTDGQLNIPESGNGIPDIIDEARWGVDVWRRAQNDDGGVGCWIEADSHPHEANPAKDMQHYNLALPTRESSMDYAAHAAMLALALKEAGQADESKLFADSAERAYVYAHDEKNGLVYSWSVTNKENKVENFRYVEPSTIPEERAFKAAYDLYLVTGNAEYKNDIEKYKDAFVKNVNELHYSTASYYMIEVGLFDDVYPELSEIYKTKLFATSKERMSWMQKWAYRKAWWPPEHGYVRHMAWGNALPFRWAKFFVASWRLSGDTSYRDAAFLANDWNNGANPQGWSLTTGLGKVFPPELLDLPSCSDGIEEPVPGLSLYIFTYGIAYNGKKMVYGMYDDARDDFGYDAKSLCFLPESFVGKQNPSFDEMSNVLNQKLPIYRRFSNIRGYAVDQNEFTVWETIGPAASVTGCLMGKGWMPSDEVKNRKPRLLSELDGYGAQP